MACAVAVFTGKISGTVHFIESKDKNPKIMY
jgi:hypothetical protein